MAVKAFFSGVESGQHFNQCMSAGVKNVLFSYWQFRKDPGLLARRKKAFPKIRIMVDSGAYSFITDPMKFRTWTRQDFDKYVQEYVAWLLQNRRHVFAAVEFDIYHPLNVILGSGLGSTIGIAIVESWQKNVFIPLQKQGIEIIYVWHKERGMEGFEDMCSKFPYVGIPGEMSTEPDFNKYITVARRYTTKLHGFAATKQLDFRDVPWFSIDSITWKTAEMYGNLIDWDSHTQRLTFEDDKSKRIFYKDKLEELGFNASGIIADNDYKEVTRYALFSMRQMEKFYEEHYSTRVFYYQLRLPHPQIVMGMNDLKVKFWWRRFRPEELFKGVSGDHVGKVRHYLAALAAVQYRLPDWITNDQVGHQFLIRFFPKLAQPLISDMTIFQKEMATYTSPPNPPALDRVDLDHFRATNNPPKEREEPVYTVEDLDPMSTVNWDAVQE